MCGRADLTRQNALHNRRITMPETTTGCATETNNLALPKGKA